MTVTVANLGFPRIGPRRELKTALEAYWAGTIDAETLRERSEGLKGAAWTRQRAAGVSHIPSNDFSLYDHVLDTSVMVGAIPPAYGWTGGPVGLDAYFAMARGAKGACGCGGESEGAPALEMTKWFDTNYHYLAPEFEPGQRFSLASTKPVDEYLEAKALGIETRPVLLGPVTYLKLGKIRSGAVDPLSLLDSLIPTYTEILRRLEKAGATWVQIDEPALVLDIDEAAHAAFARAYDELKLAAPRLKIMLTSYFGGLGGNQALALSLPVSGVHLDLVRAPEELESVVRNAPADLTLSLGVIDGRNVWRADLAAILDRIEPLHRTRDLIVAPSCSLLHTPVDLALETGLDDEAKGWLAFAVQKLEELATLARALNEGRDAVRDEIAASSKAAAARRASPRVKNAAVAERTARLDASHARRASPVAARLEKQRAQLRLPAFPTTTIGSFPQTKEVRKARADRAKGAIDEPAYDGFLRKETEAAIRWQEEIGLDVLVHGEFERNDMVQYFGEQLSGFLFTRTGWVQSYGSRCVRPPIIFGDVSRPAPMTVGWRRYAQSLTGKPVKGMLTGPVTILNWSFVRDDLPRADVCRQIAFAIRDEVCDLERDGAAIIQIDEAALREGLPLRRSQWADYLAWASECFRIAASGVADETQIHTHMCYSEFNDIADGIIALDADVISIESARSKMELLEAFAAKSYPADIGPGVYDIHAPRVPSADEMTDLLKAAAARFRPDQLWVNPDCGLKTRGWEETRPAIVNMVEAARRLRAAAS